MVYSTVSDNRTLTGISSNIIPNADISTFIADTDGDPIWVFYWGGDSIKYRKWTAVGGWEVEADFQTSIPIPTKNRFGCSHNVMADLKFHVGWLEGGGAELRTNWF